MSKMMLQLSGELTQKNKKKTKEKAVWGRDLVELVFSWSLSDVHNLNLYKDQVVKLPDTFSSTTDYFMAFIPPLIEEIHADLFSSLKTLSQAPKFEIYGIKQDKCFSAPRNLFYKIWTKGTIDLASRDLIAVADKRPTQVDDLRRYDEALLLALVCSLEPLSSDTSVLTILASKPIIFEAHDEQTNNRVGAVQNCRGMRKSLRLYGVDLINMTTYIRVWSALHPEPKGGNLNLIQKVLWRNSQVGEGCIPCLLDGQESLVPSHLHSVICSFQLNSSQEEAILRCLKARKCYHGNTIELIWGPPGTGKTKTTSLLLLCFLKMRCRVLTCAPTNIAVLEVASRVVKLVSKSLELSGSYGLGDVVLFGNGKRMKIDERDDLLDVFLDYRVSELYQCFMPLSGWRESLMSLIRLLDDPKEQYHQYLENRKKATNEAGENVEHGRKGKNAKKAWGKVDCKALIENQDEKKKRENQGKVGGYMDEISKHGFSKEEEEPLCFSQFIEKSLNYLRKSLELHFSRLCTHLPTSVLSLEVAKKMYQTINLLRGIEVSSFLDGELDQGLECIVIDSGEQNGKFKRYGNQRVTKEDCLVMLRSISDTFKLPDFLTMGPIKGLCLREARVLFCTASSSAKLNQAGLIDFLVIDEAAQLKECESTIPLQIPGLRHAILIGDERQLPAMVQSKIASEAELGRSLFERLVLLGQKKHLLNTQYRMHPSISTFPNKEFYNFEILDAQSVRFRKYTEEFLPGKMYGPYSFINIAYGREQFGQACSLKNTVEVAVVSEIAARLFTVSKETKTKISVGVISPYKAQVSAIQEKIGKTYSGDAGGLFSLNVRSVDGFQGGEEDVIIISTVRSNGNGAIGFLSSRQRANVALTRARHCLWILGNEATLSSRNSVWRELIVDAKERECFHNAGDDKFLGQTIARASVELEKFDKLLKNKILSFNHGKWKVCLSDVFQKSLKKIVDPEIYEKSLTLLEMLSRGWRQKVTEKGKAASSFQPLKQYPINDDFSLIWAVDILVENSHHIQILKVWDILPLSDVPEAVKRLDVMYRGYSNVKIQRCRAGFSDGNMVIPLKWPVVSNSGVQGNGVEDVHVSDLSGSFASLSLLGDTEAPEPSRGVHRFHSMNHSKTKVSKPKKLTKTTKSNAAR